ncbi:unnamed protein product [Bubo scandiacus]
MGVLGDTGDTGGWDGDTGTPMGARPWGTREHGDSSKAMGWGTGVAAPKCPRGGCARVPTALAPSQRPPPAGAIRGRGVRPCQRHHGTATVTVTRAGTAPHPALCHPRAGGAGGGAAGSPPPPGAGAGRRRCAAGPWGTAPARPGHPPPRTCVLTASRSSPSSPAWPTSQPPRCPWGRGGHRVATMGATRGASAGAMVAVGAGHLGVPYAGYPHPVPPTPRQKPSAICAHLTLCPGEPGGAPAAPPLGALSTRLQVAAGEALPVPLPLCWLCRTFLTRAEAAVPKEKVAAAAAGLCRVLPAVVAGACQCLAQRYAVLALEGVLGRLGPRLLCHLLLACRPEDGDTLLSPPQRPLGDTEAPCGDTEDLGPGHPLPALSPNLGPCALGPTYWCSSPEAARRCQALQHCQEHVWA